MWLKLTGFCETMSNMLRSICDLSRSHKIWTKSDCRKPYSDGERRLMMVKVGQAS